jgi:hypothetical protein
MSASSSMRFVISSFEASGPKRTSLSAAASIAMGTSKTAKRRKESRKSGRRSWGRKWAIPQNVFEALSTLPISKSSCALFTSSYTYMSMMSSKTTCSFFRSGQWTVTRGYRTVTFSPDTNLFSRRLPNVSRVAYTAIMLNVNKMLTTLYNPCRCSKFPSHSTWKHALENYLVAKDAATTAEKDAVEADVVATRAAFEHAQKKCHLVRSRGVASLMGLYRQEEEERASQARKNEQEKFRRLELIFWAKSRRMEYLKKRMQACKQCKAEMELEGLSEEQLESISLPRKRSRDEMSLQ